MDLKPNPNNPDRTIVTIEDEFDNDLLPSRIASIFHNPNERLGLREGAYDHIPRDLSVSNKRLWGAAFALVSEAQRLTHKADHPDSWTFFPSPLSASPYFRQQAEHCRELSGQILGHLSSVLDIEVVSVSPTE